MKLPIKSAGLCGCGVFVLATYTAAIRGMDPINVLYMSVTGSLVAGTIGYMIGNILSQPRGNPKRKNPKAPAKPAPKVEAMTGNETFLDDLGSPAEGSAAADTTEPKTSD